MFAAINVYEQLRQGIETIHDVIRLKEVGGKHLNVVVVMLIYVDFHLLPTIGLNLKFQ